MVVNKEWWLAQHLSIGPEDQRLEALPSHPDTLHGIRPYFHFLGLPWQRTTNWVT